MTDVFISYAREDRDLAGRIADTLEEQGFSVWWDWNLTGGENFRARIREALANADKVVVLWSRDSIVSAFVIDEAGEAKKQNKLIPITIDGSSPPLGFGDLHTIDFKDRDQGLRNLAAALRDQPVAWKNAAARTVFWRSMQKPLLALIALSVLGAIGWNIYGPSGPDISSETRQRHISTCDEATDMTSTLATTRDKQTWLNARDSFWRLYQGNMFTLETYEKRISGDGKSQVEFKMVQFGKLLREAASNPDDLPKSSLSRASRDVAKACSDFIERL